MDPTDFVADQRRIHRNRLRAILAVLLVAAVGFALVWGLLWWSSNNLFSRSFRFETYREAWRDSNFEWAVPSFLPESASDITIYMEMDDCFAIGSFRFDPAAEPACLGLSARQPADLGKPFRFFKDEDWQSRLGVSQPELPRHSLCLMPPRPEAEAPCIAKHPIAVAIDSTRGRAFFWSIDETGSD